jgi:hypothetical protein
MKRLHWLSAAAGAVALGLFSTAAGAAPLGNAAGGLTTATGENSLAQEVRYGRRCWRHRGHWHCRRGVRHYGYAPYYDSYGYGPSVGLYFGGHRHGHRHHRHHHRHHR